MQILSIVKKTYPQLQVTLGSFNAVYGSLYHDKIRYSMIVLELIAQEVIFNCANTSTQSWSLTGSVTSS